MKLLGVQISVSFHYFLLVREVTPDYMYRCPRRNVKYFGRVFLVLNYTDITQNTYIQS